MSETLTDISPTQQQLLMGVSMGYSISKRLSHPPQETIKIMYGMAVLLAYGFEMPEELPEDDGFFLFDCIFAGLSKLYPEKGEADILHEMEQIFDMEEAGGA